MGHAFSILQTQLFTWQQSGPNSALSPGMLHQNSTMGHDAVFQGRSSGMAKAGPRGPALPLQHMAKTEVSHVNPGRSWELVCTSGSAEWSAGDLC